MWNQDATSQATRRRLQDFLATAARVQATEQLDAGDGAPVSATIFALGDLSPYAVSNNDVTRALASGEDLPVLGSVAPNVSARLMRGNADSLIVCDTGGVEAHATLLTLAFASLRSGGFTPNLPRIVGARSVTIGLLGRSYELQLLGEEALSQAVTLTEFITRDSALRARLGIPPVAAFGTSGSERYRDCDHTDVTKPMGRFIANMIQQITATLAVLDEQCDGMLLNVTPDYIRLIDLEGARDAFEKPEEIEGEYFTYRLRNLSGARPENEYVEYRVPNLGFLVQLREFDRASATFNFRTLGGFRGGRPIRYARIVDPLSVTQTTRAAAYAAVAPRTLSEYWNLTRAPAFIPGYDLALMCNAFTQIPDFFLYKQHTVRRYYALEQLNHVRLFGSLRHFRTYSIDESLLANLIRSVKILPSALTVYAIAATQPIGRQATSAREFCSDNVAFSPMGATRWDRPSVPSQLRDKGAPRGSRVPIPVDLSTVAMPATAASKLRESIVRESGLIQDFFMQRVDVAASRVLAKLDRASPAFIAGGVQGLVHAGTVPGVGGVARPVAIKSFRTFSTRRRETMDALFERARAMNVETSETVNELLVTAIVSWLYESGRSPNFIHMENAFAAEREQADNETFDHEVTAEEVGARAAQIVRAARGRTDDAATRRMEALYVRSVSRALGSAETRAGSSDTAADVSRVLDRVITELTKIDSSSAARLSVIAACSIALSAVDSNFAASIEKKLSREFGIVYDDEEDDDLDDPREGATEEGDDIETASEPPSADMAPNVERLAREAAGNTEEWYSSTSAATLRDIIGDARAVHVSLRGARQTEFFVIMELIHGTLHDFPRRIVPQLQRMLLQQGTEAANVPTFDDYVDNAMQQIILSLAIYQEQFAGMHNDLHPGNVFIKYCDKTPYNGKPLCDYEYFEYRIGAAVHRVPNLGFVIKIGDLGHGSLSVVPSASGDPLSADTTVTGLRRVHKHVSFTSTGWIVENATKLTQFFTSLLPTFVSEHLPYSLSINDIAQAFRLGNAIRVYGSFIPSFDIATLVNNLSSSSAFFRMRFIDNYVCVETEREQRQLGNMDLFRRFTPNQYNNLFAGYVSVYLPRSSKFIATPADFIDLWKALPAREAPMQALAVLACVRCGRVSRGVAGPLRTPYCGAYCASAHTD
jgi:hypothetical protein